MAKQTFTTGQVLTAAQMTSLQQTAMGGGSATAKTASYVLVAADAGTTVAMNAAGATTITVNTGLFAAGDTVFIQNLGAGACTVTAGTATVATAGSAILPQNDAGILYFTATGASIFYDFIQAGGASPLTTKGDVYTFSTSDARLGVGTNGQVLTADSSEATGLKFATPTSGGMTLISTTSLSGSSITLSSIPQTYNNLQLVLQDFYPATSGTSIVVRVNSDSGGNYINMKMRSTSTALTNDTAGINSSLNDGITESGNADTNNSATANFYDYTQVLRQNYDIHFIYNTTGATPVTVKTIATYKPSTSVAITSLQILPITGNFGGGTALLYGVK